MPSGARRLCSFQRHQELVLLAPTAIGTFSSPGFSPRWDSGLLPLTFLYGVDHGGGTAPTHPPRQDGAQARIVARSGASAHAVFSGGSAVTVWTLPHST
jgi:hypothetical protein